ncbi:MAG: hypothetical protein K2H52_09770 [Lachnospiraceae bacterium]|nr:hypothetical protein [Lachnospiraceae bacterium]
MITIAGFIMLLMIVVLLLTGKVSLPPIFIIVPVGVCLFLGFSFRDISSFIGTGLQSVLNTVVLFTFAMIYFSILNDVGMFDFIFSKIMRFLGNKVELVMWITCLIATISHLDGSGAITMLVTIPMMLPVYKKMKIRPEALLLLASVCSGAMNMTPWCSSVLRLTSATGVEPLDLWRYVLPLQMICLVLSYLAVIPLARLERRHGAGMTNEEFEILKQNLNKPVKLKVSKKIIYFDMILTILLIAVMLTGFLNVNLAFMLALAIAIVVNFPDPGEQTKKIKEFGGIVLNMIMIILAIGVLIGVLTDSGMLGSMVDTLIAVIPEELGEHLTGIVSTVSVPLSILLGSDTVYMAVAPLLSNVVTLFGASVMQLDAALLVGACLSANLCLVGPTPYLALGLANVEMSSNLKYCFPWVLGISLISTICAGVLGIIPF